MTNNTPQNVQPHLVWEKNPPIESARLFEILDALSEGIVYYDAEGKLTYFNQAFVNIFSEIADVIRPGVTFEDLNDAGIERNLWDLGGQTPDEFASAHSEARSGDGVERFVCLTDGRWILRREFRTSDGGMIGIRTDISELKRQEAELVAAKGAAERADKAKSQFLANMSHEIRTPMNGVLGMAEILAGTSLDERQKEFADVIINSGQALLTILNDILDFSKIDADQMELMPAPFRIREAFEDVATLISSRAVQKGIELAVRFDKDVPATLVGDVGRIRQIVTNLVSNGVKFTDDGHVLIDVTCERTDDGCAKLWVKVEDTGIGIPKEKCAQVFEKFSQVDESASRAHEGTGLGLAISSSLVGLMGGEIGVESEVGEGSCFWFKITLPIEDEDDDVDLVETDFSGRRILVVDDNSVNRSILKQQLGDWGVETMTAPDAASALKILSDHAPDFFDLAILDYQMPMIDGAGLARLIRDNRNFSTLPIIMLTSADRLDDGTSFAALDIQGQLSKPVRTNLLRSTIAKALQSDAPMKADALTGSGAEETAVHVSAADKPKILVVEDNIVNQQVIMSMLDSLNLEYDVVENGAKAVAYYEVHKPGVIFMDVSMPVMDGLEATRRIRELEEKSTEKRSTIIAVTAHALEEDSQKCHDAGMDDYLAKPVSASRLQEALEQWGVPVR